MVVRVRERIITETPRGTAKRLASTAGGDYNVVTSRHTVRDEIAAGDGWPFHTHKYRMTGGVIQSYPHETSRVFNQYLADYFVGNSELRDHLPTDSPSDTEVAAKIVASTNPSRPDVDLPVFVGELMDFPQLIQTAGQNLLKKKKFLRRGASANLEYQFGWKPLISDLMKMINVTAFVDKRVQELENLQVSGLRRTRRFGEYSNHFIEGRVFQSNFSIWSGTVTKVTCERVWAHVKWYPQNNGWPTDQSAMRDLAREAVLGLEFDASTAWELIPFSWLIDWGANIGDYLASQRNIVPATPSPVQVMRLKASTITSGPAVNIRGEMSPIYCEVEDKSRSIAFPSLTAHLPFLNKRQLSILGSLAVLSGNSRGIARR